MLISTTITLIAIVLFILLVIKLSHIILRTVLIIAIILLVIYLISGYSLTNIPFKEKFNKDTINQEIECLANKGSWNLNEEGSFCKLPESPAAQEVQKQCSDSSQCDGLCIASEEGLGHCFNSEIKEGCYDALVDGNISNVCIT